LCENQKGTKFKKNIKKKYEGVNFALFLNGNSGKREELAVTVIILKFK
jgi:hypothetical protein